MFEKKVKEVWIVYSEWPLLYVNTHECFATHELAIEAITYYKARDPKREWWYSKSEVHDSAKFLKGKES